MSTGTDDDTHAYETGAYFAANQDIEERAEQVGGYYACNQFWNIPVTFTINARGLNGNSANSPILPSGGGELQASFTPGGTINGTNPTFTTPLAYTFILLFKNGQEMKVGVDYNYAGSTITFVAGAIPQTGDSLDCYPVL